MIAGAAAAAGRAQLLAENECGQNDGGRLQMRPGTEIRRRRGLLRWHRRAQRGRLAASVAAAAATGAGATQRFAQKRRRRRAATGRAEIGAAGVKQERRSVEAIVGVGVVNTAGVRVIVAHDVVAGWWVSGDGGGGGVSWESYAVANICCSRAIFMTALALDHTDTLTHTHSLTPTKMHFKSNSMCVQHNTSGKIVSGCTTCTRLDLGDFCTCTFHKLYNS